MRTSTNWRCVAAVGGILLALGLPAGVAARSRPSASLVYLGISERHSQPFVFHRQHVVFSYCRRDPVNDLHVRFWLHNTPYSGLHFSLVGAEGKDVGPLFPAEPNGIYNQDFMSGDFPHHRYAENRLAPGRYTYTLAFGKRTLLRLVIDLKAKRC